jgi:hypothetical protein
MLIFLLVACTPSTGTLIEPDLPGTAIVEPESERVFASEPSDWMVVLDITWPVGRPGGRPIDAHFSWLALATHEPDVSMWSLREPASPGMTDMAEWGGTQRLVVEMEDQGADVWEWRHWTCPEGIVHDNCAESGHLISLQGGQTHFSAASMLGPSPDWFIGVDSEPLVDGEFWRNEVVIDLFPLDAGTRDANAWDLYGEQSTPPWPISPILDETRQLIGPGQIGRLTLIRR